MSISEEFQANIEALPNILQRKYALLRDLDKSLQEIQRQNEQRCEQEIDDMKRGIKSGNITPNSSLLKFSDDALDEQKHAIRIADEKVALAVQAYDLVDAHIQQLDQYLKKFDEDLRRERDTMTAIGTSPTLDNNVKAGRSGETSNRGRKKTRLATATAAASASATAAAATAANSTSMELDLPVDPNEPTYCFCNQVSYGEMVACDNPDCKIEWFHYGCVGLKEQPKGKWSPWPSCFGITSQIGILNMHNPKF
ncbi:PHD finger protein ING1 [Sesamum angolense]|uniref:PHD finger protein ING1 n=1 Tax=Sesamum angolense TaxID=2727404 RepID=A0AAE1X7B1_9LAMI|nr:PHD finger protein ING1 [Sesamum angolense]